MSRAEREMNERERGSRGGWPVRVAMGALGLATRLVAPRYRARRPTRTVAIVVPLSDRAELLPEEQQSMRHLTHYLGRYDKFLVAPQGTSVAREGFQVAHFPAKFFGSAAAHNRLLIWPGFYERFRDYEYILVYHLDSLVFSDDLEAWCREGWDYIGAPWVPCADTPWVKEPRVGNGGFTLMKSESVLEVLYRRYRMKPDSFWTDLLTRNGARMRPIFHGLEWFERLMPRAAFVSRPLLHWRRSENAARHGRNNDYFWSFDAVKYLPGFRVAPVDAGLRFAFEAAPSLCYGLNGRRLPFGCHAWTKFDAGFWAPHLLPLQPHSARGPAPAGHGAPDTPPNQPSKAGGPAAATTV